MNPIGSRDYTSHDTPFMDVSSGERTYMGEGICQRFYSRLIQCVRESQEVDVMYDCRSRMIDFRECNMRHKQSTWIMRETITSMRNYEKFKNWSIKYDEDFGHPPLLEAVDTVRRKLAAEGGTDVLNPTHFKDPR